MDSFKSSIFKIFEYLNLLIKMLDEKLNISYDAENNFAWYSARRIPFISNSLILKFPQYIIRL